jgi:hypothetical protein
VPSAWDVAWKAAACPPPRSLPALLAKTLRLEFWPESTTSAPSRSSSKSRPAQWAGLRKHDRHVDAGRGRRAPWIFLRRRRNLKHDLVDDGRGRPRRGRRRLGRFLRFIASGDEVTTGAPSKSSAGVRSVPGGRISGAARMSSVLCGGLRLR